MSDAGHDSYVYSVPYPAPSFTFEGDKEVPWRGGWGKDSSGVGGRCFPIPVKSILGGPETLTTRLATYTPPLVRVRSPEASCPCPLGYLPRGWVCLSGFQGGHETQVAGIDTYGTEQGSPSLVRSP